MGRGEIERVGFPFLKVKIKPAVPKIYSLILEAIVGERIEGV